MVKRQDKVKFFEGIPLIIILPVDSNKAPWKVDADFGVKWQGPNGMSVPRVGFRSKDLKNAGVSDDHAVADGNVVGGLLDD